MQVLVGGIQRFSIEDGPGIRTTVFLKGCPLSCQWCHNPELIQFKNQLMYTASRCIGCGECVSICTTQAITFCEKNLQYDECKCLHCFACAEHCCTEALHTAAKSMTVEEIMETVLRDRGYYEKTNGGVTISGGECTQHYAFIMELIDSLKGAYINVAIDTSGYCNWERMTVLAQKADWILYDIKCMDDLLHQKLTGVSNHIIISNLRRLSEDNLTKEKILIRLPLISGVNDTPMLIEEACKLFCECGLRTVNLLPYHLLGVSKYKSLLQDYRIFEAPGRARLEQIAAVFRERGIDAEILGI